MSRKTTLLLFGGESSEHDVSIMSARNVYAAMDNEKYDVKLCYIDRSGKWWLLENWQENLAQHGGVQLTVVPGSKSLVTIPGNNVIHIDVAMPLLHGKNGEDGTVQGILSVTHIPFVGPSVVGAAVTMDKDLTKRILLQAGIPVSRWRTWHASEPKPSFDEVRMELGEIVFVKPSNAGSSHGVSKVRNEQEFLTALDKAAELDSTVLIEEAISGFEAQISVLGNENPRSTEICEIESVEDFHDFEDKYSETSTVKFHIPARISEEQAARIKQHSLDAYKLTRCKGLARIDYFVVDDNTEYLNEINAIPGFTSVSVYPKLWQETGVGYADLVDKLISLALENAI